MNKTIFITGSSRGIGKAIALKFAEKEYNVIINASSSSDELKKTYNELAKINTNILALPFDVSNYEECKKAFNTIFSKYGGIDVLINNAGISYIGLFNTMSPDKWERLLSVNINGMMNCSHLALQYMVGAHSGNIINISSMWGSMGASCEAVYSATKGAVNSFTKALAKELAPTGIRVNAIACGAIDTEMNSFLSEEEKNDLCMEIPMGRFGTPEEVAELALFLSQDSSKYITGQIIGLDGGYT